MPILDGGSLHEEYFEEDYGVLADGTSSNVVRVSCESYRDIVRGRRSEHIAHARKREGWRAERG